MNDKTQAPPGGRGQLIQELQELRQRVAELQASASSLRQAQEAAQRQNEALARELELLHTLIDNLPENVFVKDAQSRIILDNVAHRRLLGATAQAEVAGKTDFDFFPQELAAQYYADEQAILRSGQPLVREEPTLDQQQNTRWLLTTKVPIRDRQGNVAGIVGLNQDITERKQAEARLAEEHNLLRTLIDTLPDCIYAKDVEGHFILGNAAVARLMGAATPNHLIGKSDFDFYPRELAEQYAASEQPILLDGKSLLDHEEPNVDAAGHTHWDITTKVPLRDSQGKIIGLVGVTRDISGRKRMEEALRKSEEKYRTILESIEDSYYEVDLAGSLTFFNDSLCRLYGYSKDELMGMNYRQYMDSETAQVVYQTYNTVYRIGKSATAFDWALIRKDGTRRFVQVSVSLMHGPTGEPVGFRGTIRDITERKRAEVTLERRAMQLQTAAQVSRAASSILSLDELLPQAVELIRSHFDLYYTGIFLADESGQWAVLRAATPLKGVLGTGEAGQKMLQTGYRLDITAGSSSMIGMCVRTGQARTPALRAGASVALDVGEEAVRFDNPLLPLTRSEMALPLISRGQVIGAITIQSVRPADFSQEDIAVLQTMADQLAIAIENARLIESTRRRAEELTALNELSRALTTRLDVQGVVEEAHRQISRVMDTTDFYISLYDPTKNEVTFPIEVMNGKLAKTSSATLAPARSAGVRANQGFTGYLIRTQKPLLIQNSGPDQEAKLGIDNAVEYNRVTFRPGQWAVCWLGTPLLVGGRMLGTIAVMSYSDPQAFDEHDRDLLTAIAGQVAVAIQNARLFDETRERNTELATLNEIINLASQTLDLRALLDMVLRQTLQVFGFDGGLITMYNETRHKLERVVRTGLPGGIPDDPAEGLENSLCTYVFNSREPLVIEDFRQGAPIDVAGEIEAGYYSFIGVPLEARGRILGTWCGFRKSAGPFGKNTPALLQAVGRQAAFAIENARLFEQTQARAQELVILNEMSRTLSAMLDREAAIKTVYQNTSRLMDTTNFYVALYDSHKDKVSFPFYAEGERIRALQGRRRTGKGLTEYVIRTREPLLIEENVSARLKELGIESIGQESQSWLGAPMSIGDHVVGVIAVQSYTTPRLYNKRHRDLLYAIASQTAVVLENTRLFEEARTRTEEMVALNELAQALASRLSVDQVLEEVHRGVSRLLDTTNFYISLYDPDKNFPINVAESVADKQITVMPADQGLTGYIIRTRQPLLIQEDLAGYLNKLGIPQVGEPAQSWLGVPLMAGDQVLGVMAIQSFSAARAYTKHDQEMLTAIGSQASIAIQNARQFEQTQAALAKVEATHRRYLREQWDTYLSGGVDRTTGYMDGPQGLALADDRSPTSSALTVPIKLRGEPIGVLEFYNKDSSRRWGQDDQDLVTALADQAALALENARLFEDTQSRAARERMINEITARIRASMDMETILHTTAEELARTCNLSRARVHLGMGDPEGVDSGDHLADQTDPVPFQNVRR